MLIGTKKGDKVHYGGAPMRVVSARDLNTLVVVSAEGEYFDAPIRDLETEASGTVKAGVVIDARRAAKVDAYLTALEPLLGNDRNTKAAVTGAATTLGISVSAAYDAIRRYRDTGRADLLPPPTRPGGRGKSRLNPKAQQIIEDTLEKTVLKRGGSKPRKFFREVKRALEKAGLQVSQATLSDRVAKIPEHRWTKTRKGYNETRKTHDPIIDHYPEVHRPLEVVQIDHWKADIEILSDDRLEVIGRVWITLATLSWPVWITAWLATDCPATTTASSGMIAAIYAGSFAPGIAAAILSAVASSVSLKEWLRGFVCFRCGWRAYAAALLPLPLVLLLLTFALGYTPRLEGLHGRPAILLYLTMFPVSIFNGLATAMLGAGLSGKKAAGAGICCPACLSRAARCAARSSLASSGRFGICQSWPCSPTGGAAFLSPPISRSTRPASSGCRSSSRGSG